MKTCATLFSGGGGVEVGLMAAGLTPLWAVEYDPQIAAVYRANIGDHVIVADVAAVDYAALPRVDWLHASPVCTRASVANAKATESDQDLAMAAATVRAVLAQQPQVFTLENVWGYRNFAAFRLILAALEQVGYMVHYDHVNAADFGVPQTRRRLLLRAVRGLLPPLPVPVPWVGWYAALVDLLPGLPDSKLAPWQLARLPAELKTCLIGSGNTQLAQVDEKPRYAGDPSFTALENTLRNTKAILFSANGNYESRGEHHAAADDPALTVTTMALGRARAVLVKGGDFSGEDGLVLVDERTPAFGVRAGRSEAHRAVLMSGNNASTAQPITEDDPACARQSARSNVIRVISSCRVVSLSPRCLARLQSLPDWYALPPNRTLAAKVIGNMVPPLLMQRVAESMGVGEEAQ